MSTMLERRYRRQHLNCVRHITLDPKGRGVVRIHMIPPREDAENAPFLLLLNGSKLVPLNLSWAILLSCFMDRLEPFAGLEITESDWSAMAAGAVARTHKVYPFTPKERLAEDLQIMIESLVAIARGQEPEAEVAPLTLGEYAPEMTAPHRMDLMVSAMTRDGAWHCNQKCLHCYAAGQPLSDTPELTTAQWKEILTKLRAANIPQVTFTGGEPTLAFGLETLMARIKEMGYLVKLDTNGTRPKAVKRIIDAGLADMIAMDIKNSYEKYPETCGISGYDTAPIRESIQLIMSSGIDYEFRTTVMREFHTPDDIRAIAKEIQGAKGYFLQAYRDSGDILKGGCSRPTDGELHALLSAAREYLPNAELRGVE